MKKKQPKKNTYSAAHDTICANCGKIFKQSDYSDLCDTICNRKPSCSPECSKALGQ